MKNLWDMHLTTEYVQRIFSQGGGMCRCAKAQEASDYVYSTRAYAQQTPLNANE
jgi:hypothetical protein